MRSYAPKHIQDLLELGFKRQIGEIDLTKTKIEHVPNQVLVALDQISGHHFTASPIEPCFLVRELPNQRYVTVAIRNDGIFVKQGRKVDLSGHGYDQIYGLLGLRSRRGLGKWTGM